MKSMKDSPIEYDEGLDGIKIADAKSEVDSSSRGGGSSSKQVEHKADEDGEEDSQQEQYEEDFEEFEENDGLDSNEFDIPVYEESIISSSTLAPADASCLPSMASTATTVYQHADLDNDDGNRSDDDNWNPVWTARRGIIKNSSSEQTQKELEAKPNSDSLDFALLQPVASVPAAEESSTISAPDNNSEKKGLGIQV